MLTRAEKEKRSCMDDSEIMNKVKLWMRASVVSPIKIRFDINNFNNVL